VNRRIFGSIVRSAGLILSVLLIAGAAPAQFIVGAKAGIIQYIQGNVFLDSKQLPLLQDSYVQTENGQIMHTKQGRMELLLAPSVYLWLGENGSLRMEQNQLNDARMTLDQGSTLIEVVKRIKGNRIGIRLSESVVEIKKAGLYRLDAGSRELRVYGGEALVISGNRQAIIKKVKMVCLDGGLASEKFDANVADSLHAWAARRSFDLFNAGSYTREQMHWQPIALGWFRNHNFRMSFHNPIDWWNRLPPHH
jgi:hypothetical protein